jgi:hypothetical protein
MVFTLCHLEKLLRRVKTAEYLVTVLMTWT